EQDGLPSNSVMGILEDERGHLWLSTFRGISQFDPVRETFKNYTPKDGVQSHEFNNTVAFKSRDGQMFFGGINGFNAFYPRDIRDNPCIPPVVLTDFQIFNKSVHIGDDSILKKSIMETEEIVLSHRESVFSFEFAALNYQFPEKNRYKYRLEGFEDDWNEVDGARRFVTYTNLDPGEYLFRVTGSNNDGIWNEEGASVRITVTPPWWETPWFRASTLIALIVLIFSGFRRRMRRIESRKRKLEILVNEKTRELGERVKELNCLYGISHLIQEPGVSLEEILQGAVDLIPPSLRYPEIARARIVVDDQEFSTADFRETACKQTAAIATRGDRAGVLEVCYIEERPESDEGAFLKEERSLMNAVADQLGGIAEYKRTETALRRGGELLNATG
ncbi:MAG: hypothetical protein GY859_37420, partial [Desulfobacterales bacterium]|nr:hypothetical protein [Desulfobacterales bacterium]